MQASVHKYRSVMTITLKHHFAYMADLLLRTLFLLIILYVFIQLWSATYGGLGTAVIAGYTFEEIIWYLIFSESLIMAAPRINLTVEDEVKSGGIAYLLTRPMNYLLYHYSRYIGEFGIRLLVNMAVGGTLGVLLFGPPSFGFGWLAFWPVTLGAMTVNYCIRMTLALCAFWVEETQGLAFVYDKLLFTIGGMMLPLELFPEALRRVCEWLPFQTIIYFPVKIMLQAEAGRLLEMLLTQGVWVVLMGGLLLWVFGRGARKLNVNGG